MGKQTQWCVFVVVSALLGCRREGFRVWTLGLEHATLRNYCLPSSEPGTGNIVLSKTDEAWVLLEHSSGGNKMNTWTKTGKSKQIIMESDVRRVGDSSPGQCSSQWGCSLGQQVVGLCTNDLLSQMSLCQQVSIFSDTHILSLCVLISKWIGKFALRKMVSTEYQLRVFVIYFY